MHDEELSDGEREALRALPREAQPGDLLEERTVRALADRGLLRARHRVPPTLAWLGAAAACALFFVAGFSAGSARPHGDAGGAVVSPGGTEARGGNLAAGATAGDTVAQPADTAGGFALTGHDSDTKAKTQIVVWF